MIFKVKLVLFFNSDRGLKVYNYLKKKKLDIKHIFIAKKNLKKNFLKKIKKKKIKFKIIDNLNKNTVKVALKKSDVGIICGFPYIFKKSFINLNKFGLINCHAGTLPKYRGGSPLNWQIINNEKFFGLSVLKIDQGIDTGHIIEEKKIKLLKNYNIKDLHLIANKNFPKMVFKSIIKVIKKSKLKKQNKNKKNYFKQRTEKDSEVNFKKKTYKEIKLYIRALKLPYPRPYFFFKKKKFFINKVKKSNKTLKREEVIKIKKTFFAKCKDATLKLN